LLNGYFLIVKDFQLLINIFPDNRFILFLFCFCLFSFSFFLFLSLYLF
jgi:hypothetical protein